VLVLGFWQLALVIAVSLVIVAHLRHGTSTTPSRDGAPRTARRPQGA
jgi:hypothetical protein